MAEGVVGRSPAGAGCAGATARAIGAPAEVVCAIGSGAGPGAAGGGAFFAVRAVVVAAFAAIRAGGGASVFAGLDAALPAGFVAADFAGALAAGLLAGVDERFAGCFVVLLATARAAGRAAVLDGDFGDFAVASRPRVVRWAAALLSLAILLLVDLVAIVPSEPVSRRCRSPKTRPGPAAASRTTVASADR